MFAVGDQWKAVAAEAAAKSQQAVAKPTAEELAASALADLEKAAQSHAGAIARATQVPGDELIPPYLVQEVVNAGKLLDMAVAHALKYHPAEIVASVPGLHPGYVQEIKRGAPLL